jgi:hypothetical protein
MGTNRKRIPNPVDGGDRKGSREWSVESPNPRVLNWIRGDKDIAIDSGVDQIWEYSKTKVVFVFPEMDKFQPK